MTLKDLRVIVWVEKRKNGSHVGRLRYTDAAGKVREITRKGSSKRDAKQRIEAAMEELKATLSVLGVKAPESTQPQPALGPAGEGRTLDDYLNHYEAEYLVPAIYRDGQKINDGLAPATMRKCREFIKSFRAEFGTKPIASITYHDIRRYRDKLIETPTVWGRPRAAGSINSMLHLLQQILETARFEKWIDTNPFKNAPKNRGLIRASANNKRTRILSRAEERRLLTAAVRRTRGRASSKGVFMFTFIVWGIDTGMREGEIIQCTWSWIDLGRDVINIPWWATKTKKARTVPISARLREQLLILDGKRKAKARRTGVIPPDSRILGWEAYPWKMFVRTKEAAGLEGLTFHDLRHTCVTRLIKTRLVTSFEVAKVVGHKVPIGKEEDLEQTFDYFSVDDETLDNFRKAANYSNSLTEAWEEKSAAQNAG